MGAKAARRTLKKLTPAYFDWENVAFVSSVNLQFLFANQRIPKDDLNITDYIV